MGMGLDALTFRDSYDFNSGSQGSSNSSGFGGNNNCNTHPPQIQHNTTSHTHHPTSHTINLQKESILDILFAKAEGGLRSLNPKARDDANVSSYHGLLNAAPIMPNPGSKEHTSIYIATMVSYFYDYMRLTGIFTQEQNREVDKAAEMTKIFIQYKQITGRDIPDL